MDKPDPDVVAPLNTSSTIDPIGVVASSPELVIIIGPNTQLDPDAVAVVELVDAAVVGRVSPGIPVLFRVLAVTVAADELAAARPSTPALGKTVSVHRCRLELASRLVPATA
jgi:hypothetical protein